jgi:hypothetical protein
LLEVSLVLRVVIGHLLASETGNPSGERSVVRLMERLLILGVPTFFSIIRPSLCFLSPIPSIVALHELIAK